MSRQRQMARAERERAAQARATHRAAQAQRVASARSRREQRSTAWRRVRLWQHGPAFARNRERWGVLVTLLLTVLLLVYLVSRSVGAVFVTALALVICTPVLVVLFVDRRP